MIVITNKKPVYCMHCENWYEYALKRDNQCNIGKTEKGNLSSNITGFKAVVSQNIYGEPSELNKNNDCNYYNETSLLGKLSRRIFFGIPFKPTIETKVK